MMGQEMKLNIMKLHKIRNFLWGNTIFLFCASLLIGTLSDKISNYLFCAAFLLLAVGAILWLMMPCNNTHVFSLRTPAFQLFMVAFVLWIFWILTILNHEPGIGSVKVKYAGLISLTLMLFITTIKVAKQLGFPHEINTIIFLLKQFIKEHRWMLLVLVFLSILLTFNFNTSYKIDSSIYYRAIVDNKSNWCFSLADMKPFSLGGHIAYAYAILLYIGEYVWPLHGYGVRLMNMLLSIITAWLFYRIVEKIFSQRISRLNQALIAAIFSFSPLFFGISYILSIDFAVLCFFALFVYSDFYDMKLLKALAICGICFSKESACVLVAGYYIGEALTSIISTRKQHGKMHIFKNLFQPYKLCIYSGAFIFLANLLTSDSLWSRRFRSIFTEETGETQTATQLSEGVSSLQYLLIKVKQMFCLNFFWLIFVLLIVMVVRWLYKKVCFKETVSGKIELENKKQILLYDERSYLLPFLISFLFFFVAQIAYFTYVHYRYIQPWLFFYVIALGAMIIYAFKREKTRTIILSVFTLLFLVESFITIDPVSYALFTNVNVGNGSVITTRTYLYDEMKSMFYVGIDGELMAYALAAGDEYNRECIGFEHLLEQTFSDIDYDSAKLVVLDDFGNNSSNTIRILFGGKPNEIHYYDKTIGFNTEGVGNYINYAFPWEEINAKQYSKIYYLKFFINPYINDIFTENHAVMNITEENYGRWAVTLYEIETNF